MKLDATGVVMPCPECGRRNRLPYDQLDRRHRCGSCRAALPPPAEPIDIVDEALFAPLVERSALPVLVDFWAAWCGPCQMMAPELKKVARALAGRVLVVKVDTEAMPNLARRYRIASLPTLNLLSHGREVDRIMGARSGLAVQQWLERQSTGPGAR